MSGEDIYEGLDDEPPRLGYLPDPPDERDLHFDKLQIADGWLAAPDEASVAHLLHEPFNQGNIGSCVAQSVAQALFVSHSHQGVTPKVASRLAIYWLARATHRMQHFDSGTFIRAAFQVLNKFGFAAEESWTYSTKRFADKPPFKVFALAYDQSSGRRPAIYWRIWGDGQSRVDQVKSAIANGFAVVFGTDVGRAFLDHRGTGIINPLAGERVGGHAMVFCGYEAGSCRLINSWGKSWGDRGYADVPWDFVADGARDVWVVEHAPPYA